MKTQYFTATSLDGFIADPHHSLDWLLQFGMPNDPTYSAFMGEVGAQVMGSSTYEWVLAELSKDGADPARGWPTRDPAFVFTTRSLPTIAGADIRFVRGDVRPVHEQLVKAAAGKNVWIAGGGDLAGQFYDAGLLDEIIVQVAPVTLGAGRPLLPRRIARPPLRLVSVSPFGGEFAQLRYEVPHPR